MKKILFESSSFTEKSSFSGVGYYSKMLSEALGQKFHVDKTSGPFKKTALNKVYRKLASYRLAPVFDGLDRPYDIVIFPNFATWPTRKSKLRATVIHDLTYLKYPDSVSSKNLDYLRRVVPQSIKTSNFIITVSETVKNELMEEFNIPPDKIVVTPIPPRPGFGDNPKTEIHEKYSIPTKKYFLFIGNMEPRKNIGTLVDAYLALPKEIKNEYSLVLGGSRGWNSEDYQKKIDMAMEDGGNVRHVGFIDDEDMETFYKKAHFFVFPSLYEGFGMPILESLACKTPIITSDISVFREILGDTGIYCDPYSVDEWTKTMTRYSADILSRGSALKAQHSVHGRYSWSSNVDKILKLLS